MCGIVNQCVNGLLATATMARRVVQQGFDALDRKLVQFTQENLPDTTARVVQAMYRTFPITACFLFAPVPTLVGLAVVHIVELGPVFRPETYVKIANSIAHIPLIRAIDATVRFLLTQSPLYKEVIIVQLIWAAIFRSAVYTLLE